MNKIGTWNDFQNDVRKNGCFSAPDSPAQFWFSFPLAQRWDMVLRTFGSNLGRTGLGSAVFFWVVSDKFWNVSLLPSQGMTAFYSKRSLWAIWNMDCMFLQSLPRCDPDLTVMCSHHHSSDGGPCLPFLWVAAFWLLLPFPSSITNI